MSVDLSQEAVSLELLSHINVLAELDRMDVRYEWAAEDEVRCICPYHDDSKPSCMVNVKKRVFKCHVAGCERDGDFISFMAAVVKQSKSVLIIELCRRYGLEVGKIVDPSVVERYHQAIWAAFGMLAELRKRAVTDKIIRERRLGYTEDGRISIPIKSPSGLWVNIRRYLPGAPGREKMKNQRGYGKARLYPEDQMHYPSILYCGGELKALVAAEQLNPHGWGAVCQTAGEGNFDVELLKEFAGKTVGVCMDVDHAGVQAASRRCAQFAGVAEHVLGPLELPLDTRKHPKGDINDFVAMGGDMWPLVEALTEWVPPLRGIVDSEPVDMPLLAACSAASAGRRVRVRAVMSAVGEAPYSIPKTVTVRCDKSQRECALCTVYAATSPTFEIHPESPAILEMVGATKKSVQDGLASAIGVPRTCRVVEYDTTEYFNAEDCRVSPQMEITNRASDRVMQPAVCISDANKFVELNETYSMVGRMHPHPDTQQSTLLMSSYEPTQDALSTYEARDVEQLTLFKPHEWTCDGISEKLDAIYADLEANVTKIYKRRDLHLFTDLTYHSPLLIDFDGKTHKGWVETLLLGDSSCGKSEVVCGARGDAGLMTHYGLGVKVDCKGATTAGLLGGLQQLGGRFFVSWGIIPTHDKRLVVLEELKGLRPEVFSALTDMRSSGKAQIPKIEKRQTYARTRLIAISNPPRDRVMSSFNFPVEAVRELIMNPEDVRRFDAALLVNSSEVPPEMLNMLAANRPVVPHVFSGNLCKALVLWAWTRDVEHVRFDDEAVKLVLQEATRLSARFTYDIPLIDRGSARLKIARLSAALAARTFSHEDDDATILRVRECHVRYVGQMLDRVYSSPASGYLDLTAAVSINEVVVDPEMIKRRIADLPFPRDFVRQILNATRIDQQDLQDWNAWERPESADLLAFLVRKHALVRENRAYRKTPPFIVMLKGLLSDAGSLPDKPSYIKEEF